MSEVRPAIVDAVAPEVPGRVGGGDGAAATAAAIRAWRRRVAAGLAVGGFADGCGATALGGAAGLLLLRVFGHVAAPSPWWLFALAIPVASAARRVRTGLPSAATAALFLDRALRLDGLLLTGTERDASAWDARLAAGVRRVPDVVPRIRWGRAAVRALVPGLALLAVVGLPWGGPSRPPADAAVAEALARFERRVDELARDHGLREDVLRDVRDRVEALERRRDAGGEVRWSDVDALVERTDRHVASRVTALAEAAVRLRAFAATPPAAGADAQASLSALLAATDTLGLLDGVPPEVAAAGLADRQEGGELSGDAEALAALASAMAATAGDRVERLARSGALSAADRESLERLLAGDPIAQRLRDGTCRTCGGDGGCDGPCRECGGTGRCTASGGTVPGRGGITRGRGDARLDLTGSTPEGAAAGQPQRLPPGAPVPTPSVRISLGRATPEAAPVRDGGAGTAGDTGVGVAAWRRRIAPRHRDAVRTFFDGDAGRVQRPPPPPATVPGK